MKKKYAQWLFVLSIPLTLVGYFLQTILIPIQNFHLLSKSEVLKTQKELALNYPLGTFLMYLGLSFFGLSLLSGILKLGRRIFKGQDQAK